MFSICCLLLVNMVNAQSVLSGRIYENKTNISLSGIRIENLRSHVISVSDANGKFAIGASVGDRICFTGYSYHPDTLFVADLKAIAIYLEIQQNMLNEVKVITPEIKTGSLTAPAPVGPFGSRAVQYQTDGAGNYIGGIKIKFVDWKDKRKEKDAKTIADEIKQEEIAKVFTPQNLQSYVPIRGQEMQNFIILYTPDVKTYCSSKFNLTDYLSDSYKEFLKIPSDKRQSEGFLKLTANQ